MGANSKYFFVVEKMDVLDGHKLRAMKPDADGYYNDVPIMVLGVPTLNNVTYNPEPTVKCITDPQSRFNLMLRGGSLYGEFDHPPVRTKQDLPRLLEIRRKEESHHFRSVRTVDVPLASGGILVVGSVKPTGPYGPYMKESLENPHENTSFSVRSLCEEHTDPRTGKLFRDIQILVTFDGVNSSGFKEASKRYTPGVECLEVGPEDFPRANGQVGMESSIISDREFISLFGSKHIQITRTAIPVDGTYFPGSRTYLDKDGNRRSLCHQLYKR